MQLTETPAVPTTHPIHISDKLGKLQPLVTSLINNSSKRRIRYAAISVSEVLDRVVPSGTTNGKYENWTFINGISAFVTPARLRTFKDSVQCVCCGRKGNVFLLERHQNEQPGQYINLYSAHNNTLTLMTVDHILPDSLGGKYSSTNFQTMCEPCNAAKQNYMPVEDIHKVLSNVDMYAKHWVNRTLLAKLLEIQLMYHTSPADARTLFLHLFNKYRLSIRIGISPVCTARIIRSINYELDLRTHIAYKKPWVVIVYCKILHKVISLFPLKYVA